jgi:allophanate hydrolase
LIGKTNLDQFATGLVGTRSPYGVCASVFDSRSISGGSSSGSAVAVASGLVSFSLGTDTAGSGRVPAAFNNIVGLKPSRGLLSTSGVVPACRSLDCVSIFARSCDDAQAVFNVAHGEDAGDPFSRSYPAGAPSFASTDMRLGILASDQMEFFGDEDYKRAYWQLIQLLKSQGHGLVEIDFSPFRAAADLLYAGPYVAERFAAVGAFVKDNLKDVDPVVAGIVMAAGKWTAADAYNALYKLKALEKVTDKVWEKIDVLVLPTAPTTYTIAQVQADPVRLNSNLGYYTNFVNLLDHCGVAVPAGFAKPELPFGVTVIGPRFHDASLLRFARQMHELQAPKSWIQLGVVGAHLSGQPLNSQLTDRGARFVRADKTAGDYRFYALTNTKPAKPGLIRELGFDGPGIEIEIWSIHESQFGSFVAAVPAPLSIGTCILSDGSAVKGFLCEPYAIAGMPEITSHAGWRAYLSANSPSR